MGNGHIIASLPLPMYVVRGDQRGSFECKLMFDIVCKNCAHQFVQLYLFVFRTECNIYNYLILYPTHVIYARKGNLLKCLEYDSMKYNIFEQNIK